MILSEFAGCNRALGGTLKINPFNIEDITKIMDSVIQMVPEEREQRLQRAFHYIKQRSTQKWAENFLKDLIRHSIRSTDSVFQFLGLGL